MHKARKCDFTKKGKHIYIKIYVWFHYNYEEYMFNN